MHIYAVGGNPQAARLTGIPVAFVLIFAYGVSGLLSGLGGVMSASRLYSAQGQLGIGYELDAIAAVILGGTSFVGGIGTVFGTLIGALIICRPEQWTYIDERFLLLAIGHQGCGHHPGCNARQIAHARSSRIGKHK